MSFGPRLLLSTRPAPLCRRRRRVGSGSMRIIGPTCSRQRITPDRGIEAGRLRMRLPRATLRRIIFLKRIGGWDIHTRFSSMSKSKFLQACCKYLLFHRLDQELVRQDPYPSHKAVTRIYFRSGVGGRHSIACMAEARRAEEGVEFLGRRQRAPSPPVRGLRERCKLPQLGPGRSPDRNRFWCISKLVEGNFRIQLVRLHVQI